MQLFVLSVLAASLSPAAAAAAAPVDQDALCMVVMMDTVILARQRTDLSPGHLEAVQSFETSIGYFIGNTMARHSEDALPDTLIAARASFAAVTDKSKAATECNERYRSAVRKMMAAAQKTLGK